MRGDERLALSVIREPRATWAPDAAREPRGGAVACEEFEEDGLLGGSG